LPTLLLSFRPLYSLYSEVNRVQEVLDCYGVSNFTWDTTSVAVRLQTFVAHSLAKQTLTYLN